MDKKDGESMREEKRDERRRREGEKNSGYGNKK